jgi:hypothetical protein
MFWELTFVRSTLASKKEKRKKKKTSLLPPCLPLSLSSSLPPSLWSVAGWPALCHLAYAFHRFFIFFFIFFFSFCN